ncbi:VIT domain-containing protein [uncultured Aquimarina sp.]|uniref:VIT domain-containing protein n=1 Tax=uncultured Aquimarina sp. TaxID=575652 RepID=UPI0026057D40|nr:VIT domain-containing protein [uncultured Aquimarina sp.]
MNKVYTSVLFLLFSFLVSAQEIPVLKVSDKPIGLSSLDVKVDVIGNIATTTYDMLFYNPTGNVLEGELSFPLGEGHDVSRFALDVNGKLREAVVVEKELGRIAFEAVVRKRVDPALLEKGTGNTYKARIYPIPANGYKRIVLAYEQELVYTDNAHYYDLPLGFKNKLDHFSLKMIVFDQKSKPIIEKGQLSGLEFSNWEKHYSTTITKKNYIPNKDLLIKIPVPLNTEKIITSENYFYVYKTVQPENRLRKKAKEITIYWDASLSMKERELQKELDFLNAYFLYTPNIDVNFITFSNVRLSEKKFRIKDGNWKSLRSKIETVSYDGGTSYDSIFGGKQVSDIVFLFSDGIASLSEYSMENNRPVFIVNSIVKANHSVLKNSAENTNGAYINLKTKSILDAMTAIKYESFKFLGYESKTKNGEVYPNIPVSLSHDFSIAGKGFEKNETLLLNFGYGTEITQSIPIKINANPTKNINVRRVWAQKKLDQLQRDTKKNKEQITALGKSYSLVTAFTSLIVLEDIQDYITYQITPPEELLEEYNQILASKDVIKNDRVNSQSISADDIGEKIPVEQSFEIVQEEKIAESPLLQSVNDGLEEIVELDEIVDAEEDEELLSVPFSVIEQVPVFPGCEQNISNDDRKKCFSDSVKNLVNGNYNSQMTRDLNLSPGVKRMYARFMINREGDVVNIEVRGSHNKLAEEAIRVLKLLPKMTPGKQRNRSVDVNYVLPIIVNVQNNGRSANTYTLEGSVVLRANTLPPNSNVSSARTNIIRPSFKKYSGDLTIKDRKIMLDYVLELRKAKNKEEAYNIYLKQREKYIKIPAYFVDVSNHFRKRFNDNMYASRILSNIPETDFDNYELLKVYGYQLQATNHNKHTVFIFERILELRPEDSQSYRDLALAYENEGKCQEALDLLNKIVTGEIYKNSKRRVFKGIEDIAKNEIRTLIDKYKDDMDLSEIDKELLAPIVYDIRVTTDWNHNDTDIDLHIIDPNLEECYYSHNKTSIGGHMSQDMTEGFGPEEFTLKKAIKGIYFVKIKYYGDRYQKVENPTFMKITMFKKYGSSKESRETRVIRLTKKDNEEVIAKIVF